jgi:hypothetical protein
MAGVGLPPSLGLTSDEIMRLLIPAMAQQPPSLLGAQVNQPTPAPVAAPLVPPVAPVPEAPIPVNPFMQAFENYGRSWAEPGFASQWPIPRGEQNSGAGNVLAGFGNNLLNAPQNLWNMGSAFTGRGSTDAAVQAGQGIWDFLVKPEGQVRADQSGPATPDPGFTPGLPQSGLNSKIIKTESGGNNTAKNPLSSAYGAGQFTKGTWKEFIRETNPELLKNASEKEILELRADPVWADKGVSWYAGKGVDALDSINQPATDTNLYLHHFLGTGGVKKLLTADLEAPVSSVLDEDQIKANPTVLGGNRTVQDVIDWAAGHMGEGAGVRPTPRPAQAMPDFAAANNWFDQAAPTPVDAAKVQDLQLQMMLAGLGEGLASVDAAHEGGAALFSALAAGSGKGVQAGKAMSLQFDEQFKADKRDYALGRGNLALSQEEATRATKNANAENDWMNSNDSAAYENADIAAKRQSAAQKRMTNVPKILETSDKGMWVQTPDGVTQFISNESPYDTIEQMGKTFGLDSPQVRQMKYATMANGGNILQFEMEIIKDLLTDGLGSSIWGDAYTDAMNTAQENMPPGIDPTKSLPELNKIVAGYLMGGSQAGANWDWVMAAMMLVQNGTFDNE